MNKPWLLIAGEEWYPRRGTDDWIGRYSTFEEADNLVEKTRIFPVGCVNDSCTYKINGQRYHWYKIVNLETWEPQ